MSSGNEGPAESVPAQSVLVDPSELGRVGGRPGLLKYFKQLWNYRSFIIFDSRSRIASGNAQDFLGQFWLILNPLLNGATYFFVFGLLLGTGRGVENFISYLIVGVFMFRFTSSAVLAGSRAISSNKQIVRAFHFPRATLPIAVNVRELMTQIPAFITMLVLIMLIPPHAEIGWTWFLFIPVLALQLLFNLGLSFFLARLVDRWNDIANLVSFGTRIWMYLSCVFYSVDRFAQHDTIMAIMQANPMFCVLDIARDSLVYGQLPSANSWMVLTLWTVGALIIGFLFFWQAEETYGQEK
ncbi:phosphate ABC transporter permease [Auritidibacter sp. NML120779]|uniref:ABC transporter permease n=1 Tax=Auritidibacter ignavus TaxID=678932 RepID=UPI000D7292B9|nr:ABC transporter permease [Auritidibacter ignavus]PXA79010.1 phosphate ABC transporter permease [Auritidibacter sp. NML120779]WHS35094.1 ABC transporter permease [Auritidibacter ignavus]